MTGCYRPAINTFIEARKQKIDESNAAHGLGPDHNRAKARTHPNAIPELVKRFKEEVLGQPAQFSGAQRIGECPFHVEGGLRIGRILS